MTLAQTIEAVRLLGFETEAQPHLEEAVLYAAVNRALCVIAAEVRPLTGQLLLRQTDGAGSLPDGTETPHAADGGFLRYDCRAIAAAQGDDRFLSVLRVDCRLPDGRALPPGDWRLEADRFLLLPARDCTAVCRYERLVPCLTPADPADTPLPVDGEVQPLVPLLAGFYAWLDDDERKAMLYYNDYLARAAALRKKETGTAAWVTGGRLGF